MPRKQIAKTNRSAAERAAEHYLYHMCGCDPPQICRATRTQWQAVDYWGSDVWGRTIRGKCYYAQVTAGQNEAVRTRRRKLEKISWNPYDWVMVLQLVEQQDPADNRRKAFYFRVHEYLHESDKSWYVRPEAYPVPREWFKKLRVDAK